MWTKSAYKCSNIIFLSPVAASSCRWLGRGTSTSLCATLRRCSPWLSQTTRGRVWRLTQTPPCPLARRMFSPYPAMRRRVHTWLKQGRNAPRDWLSLTVTRTRPTVLQQQETSLTLNRSSLTLLSAVWNLQYVYIDHVCDGFIRISYQK